MSGFTYVKIRPSEGAKFDKEAPENGGYLSFDNIMKMAGVDDGTSDDARWRKILAVQQRLREIMDNNSQYTDSEGDEIDKPKAKEEETNRPEEKEELPEWGDKFGEVCEAMKKPNASPEELSPELRRCWEIANAISMFPDKNLVDKLYAMRGEPNFSAIWKGLLQENWQGGEERLAAHENDLRYSGEHSWKMVDGQDGKIVKHRISDLDGSGLDLIIANNRVVIIHSEKKGSKPEEVSAEKDQKLEEVSIKQVQALKKYFKVAGVTLEKEGIKELESVKVAGDDGRRLADHLSGFVRLDDAGEGRNTVKFVNQSVERYDIADDETQDTAENSQVAGGGRQLLTNYARGHTDDGKDIPEGDSFQFMAPQRIKEVDRKLKDDALKALYDKYKEKHVSPEVIKIVPGWGGFRMMVWGSEKDMLNEGKIDKKTGIKSRTSILELRYRYGPPPVCKLYDQNLAKLDKNAAASILKAFSKQGCKYFVIPAPGSGIPKDAYKAFLEGCISSGIVPKLPDTPKFGAGEAKDMAKAFEEFPDASKAKGVEFALRFAHQMMKPGTEDLSPYNMQFLQHARFAYFINKSKESMMENLAAGVGNGELDKIDIITAKKAMRVLVESISKGVMPRVDVSGNLMRDAGGKLMYEIYNPLDESLHSKDGKLQKFLDSYIKTERGNVLAEINELYSKSESNSAGKWENVIRNIDSKYDTLLSGVCDGVVLLKSDNLKFTFPKASADKSGSQNNQQSGNQQNNQRSHNNNGNGGGSNRNKSLAVGRRVNKIR
ncbi:MAG: hypothetical protein IJ529_04260 [Alphaproteobacteria bacterium]|nr:hypothetical protein [Alphaproteobacteria bacterium]MBQ9235651.1 hypothetical protein [Alphaproteobacteria bacterium]